MVFPIGIDIQEGYVFVIAGRTLLNAERAGFIGQITSALVIRGNWELTGPVNFNGDTILQPLLRMK